MSDFNTSAPALRIRIHCVQTALHTWSTTCAHLLLDPEDVIEVQSAICFLHGLDSLLAQGFQFRECETLVHRQQAHHHGLLHRHFEQQFSNAITQRAQSCFQHTGDCVSEVAFVAIGFAVAGIKADCFSIYSFCVEQPSALYSPPTMFRASSVSHTVWRFLPFSII